MTLFENDHATLSASLSQAEQMIRLTLDEGFGGSASMLLDSGEASLVVGRLTKLIAHLKEKNSRENPA